MPKSRRALLCCLAFLLTAFIGAGSALATGYKVCFDYQQCHSCDYFDSQGNYLFAITWCWSN